MANDKLVPVGSMEVSRPSFLPKGAPRGLEHLTKDDVQMPRLALAQKTSHEVDPTDPKYIKGLQFTDLFNSLTGEILGKGPIEFTVLRADPPHWIEFFPLESGGGVRDMNVPNGDPRTQFIDGQPPVATKFYEYILLQLPLHGDPMMSVIALSLKSTGLKVAKQLNGYMRFRNADTFAGRYVLTTATEKNSKGTYAVYQIRNAPSPREWVTEEEYKIAEKLAEAIKDRPLAIDRDAARDEADFPFGENVKEE